MTDDLVGKFFQSPNYLWKVLSYVRHETWNCLCINTGTTLYCYEREFRPNLCEKPEDAELSGHYYQGINCVRKIVARNEGPAHYTTCDRTGGLGGAEYSFLIDRLCAPPEVQWASPSGSPELRPAEEKPVDVVNTHTMSPYFRKNNEIICQDCGNSADWCALRKVCATPGTRRYAKDLEADTYRRMVDLKILQAGDVDFRAANAKKAALKRKLPGYEGLRTGLDGVVCTFGLGRK